MFSGRDKENPDMGKPFAFMVMKKESIAGEYLSLLIRTGYFLTNG